MARPSGLWPVFRFVPQHGPAQSKYGQPPPPAVVVFGLFNRKSCHLEMTSKVARAA
jgi:hypothetical protein